MTKTTAPLRDPELLRMLGGEPELLAIADALVETRGERPATRLEQQRRRWKPPSVVAAAVVAAATVAVLLVSPWNGSDGGLVQRALAAVGTGPVMHIVVEDSTTTAFFNVGTGRETGGTSREEIWIDRRNNRYQIIKSQGRRFVVDLNGTFRSRPGLGDRPGFSAASLVRFYVALATGSHTAVVGRGTFDGRHILWLRSPSSEAPEEVGVDAHTYRPVLLRFNQPPSPYYYERVLLAKAIPYSPADFKRRGRLPILSRVLRFTALETPGFTLARTNPSAAHGTVVRAPWLTAGTAIGGLKLRAVTPFTFRKQNHGAPNPTVHGLELVYGPPSHGEAPTRIDVFGPRSSPREKTRSITIYEFRRVRFGPSASWSNFPADSIQVQSLYTTVGNHVVPTPWIGYMRKQGIYLTISTPHGQRTPLQVARSLHTGQR